MIWKVALFAVLMTALPPGPESDQPHLGGSMAFAAAGPDGKSIFMQNCTPCHGDDGKGKAAVDTPNFTDAKIQAGLSNQDMINIITNGKQGTIMPAWKGKLSTEEIAAVAAFVRSLGPTGGTKSPK